MGAITFTASDTDGPTGTNTGTTLDWNEPSGGQKTLVEPIPGWGTGFKFIGEGDPQFYTAEVKINTASQATQRAAVDAWETLKGGKGTLSITEQDYAPSDFTYMVLVEVETIYKFMLLTRLVLRFAQGAE